MKVQLVDVDSLETNTVQPKDRISPKKLERLKFVLKSRGMCKPISIARLGKRLIVIDGHRTLEAWRSLGHATIECCVTDVRSEQDAQALFAEMNSCTRQMASRAYLEQWANATDGDSQLRAMGPRAVTVRKFIKVFGDTAARHYGKRGDVDPSVASRAELAARTIGLYSPPPPVAKVGHWMIKHRAMVDVLWLCKYGTPTQLRRMNAAIVKNVPLALRKRTRRPGRAAA